ncbi:MAG: carbohydrate ABC transporter permease [Spirochaetaceae bacterium]|jgi:multiple sugar transport system permease protein|nr:carbohydrate ABC transporter permease [Spirochaetaceae bacterium]
MMTVAITAENKQKILADKLGFAILFLFLMLLSFLFLVPLFWLLTCSFKQPAELFAVPVQWLPKKFGFENYIRMFNYFPFLRYLKNTLIIVFCNIIGSTASSAVVAYGFSRLRWKGRDTVFVLVLVTMILPFQAVMVPLFMLFQQIGWIGTFLPLTLTCFFGNPFYIFLMRQFFLSLPEELNEAARIDGSGEFRTFFQIAIPLSSPVLATVAIFSFLRSWNDFIGPLIFLANDKLYTLAIGAQLIRSRLQPNWEILMPLGVIMVIPVLIIFFLMQKYFIEGISMSGIKG